MSRSNFYKPTGIPNAPSASLIHEVRMIFQHFINARTTQSIFGKQKSAAPAMVCVSCVRLGKKPKAAAAIMNGNTTCIDHIV